MKRNTILIIIFLLFIVAIITILYHSNNTFRMTISSSSFKNNADIPKIFTCDGENTTPPLLFNDIPITAKSLVLFVEDPDAPGGTFVHWVLFNIPASTKGLGEDVLPDNIGIGVNSSGKPEYMGPCPPSGTHHYHFELYALDTDIDIKGNPDADIVRKFMQGHILAKAELIGLYSHK